MSHVQDAAKIAFAHEFITQLPHGYDTEIGQRGGLLSGGQKQRIAIARSVVSQPKVLLLDEATSALDPHSEGIVQQALDRASIGRTTIVIAHKLATIRKADNIIVMAKGCIVEHGTHESLIAHNGTYARLVKIQQLMVRDEEGSDSTGREEDDECAEKAEEMGDPAHIERSLTRYPTADQERMEVALLERDNFDYYKPLGLIRTVYRLVVETPELAWAYLAVVVGCVSSGE